MSFKANGYTMGGGTGAWSHIPFNLNLMGPSYTGLGKDRPTAPTGYGANNFVAPGCANFVVAAGRTFDHGSWGVGGNVKFYFNLSDDLVAHANHYSGLAPSDFKLTKPITLHNHSLVLGFDLTNKTTEGDPYDNALYGSRDSGDGARYFFPYFGATNAVASIARPIINSLGSNVYGESLYAFFDNSLYAQAGVYQTLSTSFLSDEGRNSPTIGTINGNAPYFRLAWQHSWAANFLEVGALYFNAPLINISGIPQATAQNTYSDWGVDAIYQRTFGSDTLAVTANFLHEDQDRSASFHAGKSSSPTDSLDQFRVAAAYYWHNTYGLTLAYNMISGSTDPKLYPAGSLTGSLAHSPNTQSIIAEVNWTPFANNTDPAKGFPWANVRIGLQYVWYLQFNGQTTNYDGAGRNASDNNMLVLYTWWSF